MKKIFKQSALLLRLPALLSQAKQEGLFQTDNGSLAIVDKSIEYISNVVNDITSKLKAGDATILQYTVLLHREFEQMVGTKNTTISYLIAFNVFCTEYRLMLAKTIYDTSMKQLKKVKARGVQKVHKNLDRVAVINERNEAISQAKADQLEIEACTLILLEAIGVGADKDVTRDEVQVLAEKLLHILEMHEEVEEMNRLDIFEDE